MQTPNRYGTLLGKEFMYGTKSAIPGSLDPEDDLWAAVGRGIYGCDIASARSLGPSLCLYAWSEKGMPCLG
jgi:hypothetical protein